MSHTPETKPGEQRYWLDDAKNVDKVVYGLYTVCAFLLAVDLLDIFGVLYDKHVHHDFESWFGFYGFFGLIGSVGLVLASKLLRKVVMRREDYYDQ